MPRDTIISLPKSKTSTGIYAVRDENVQHHAPREAKKQAPDHGFVAMTEVGMFQELNERLQLKLQQVEAQKERAVAAEAQAEGEVAKVRHELQEERRSAALAERDLRQQLEAERARGDQAESLANEPRVKVSQLSRQLEVERGEVQRAAAHAQRAGQAADAAHEMLLAERGAGDERAARAAAEAMERADAARAAAEGERDELLRRLGEVEEDVEAEREWRESAQRQAAKLAKQAEAAAAAADREEATAQNLRRALETLRQQNEAAESGRKEEAERRRSGAARRARDRQTSEARDKEALRATVQALEHQLEAAQHRLDDLPRMQAEIRRLKELNRRHATAGAPAGAGAGAGGSPGGGHGGHGGKKLGDKGGASRSRMSPTRRAGGSSPRAGSSHDDEELPLFMRD